ncbi:hypothetical protein [Longimicrobium terrae]|uniref:Attaching and effacing protein n=1 Tax=Longimicrobium terrae TaxID=1639882 RepID=A0A841GW01_9BACT|nr:hypothetical protein [Longimicrobium terrae]MBB4635279.1 hypothetical protein [Longimicrobium terrae]MBB6069673.1 hypothetical protein [Longimicrobium terrae]NNC31116.1 hypothetical protein [Longimicrobium terrae]
MRPRSVLLAILLLPLTGCDSPSGVRAGSPARVDVVSGDLQQDTVGQMLQQALVVRVVDDKGRPVEGQTVNFRVVSGGGSVFAGVSTTDRQGEARERWTLGTAAADSQRVEARAVGTQSGDPLVFGVFRAVAVADAFASLTAVGATAYSGTAQDPVTDSLTVRAQDRYGNPVAGVEVRWSAVQGGGSFSPAVSTTGSTGVVRSQWTLGAGTGAQTGRAAAGAAPPVDFAAAATPLPPVQLEILPRTLSFASLGETLALSVIARDRTGAPIGGLPVNVSSENAAVVRVTSTPSAISQGNGSARIIAMLGTLRDTVTAAVRQVATTIEISHSSRNAESRDSIVLVADSIRQITATARDARSYSIEDAVIAFASSAPAVATVNAAGTVRGAGAGIAVITGTSGGASASLPVRVYAGTLVVSQIAAGKDHTCAIDVRGRTLCWGRGVGRGSPAPVVIGGPALASLAGGGDDYICGLTAQGAAYCWGDNSFGRLGNRSTTASANPVAVAGGHVFTTLAVAPAFACGLATSGAVYCWGVGSSGALGNGQFLGSSVPVPVTGGITFAHIAAGEHHVCGTSTSGAAYCWGASRLGEGGFQSGECPASFPEANAACVNVPTRVPGSVVFRSLVLGYLYSCGLTEDGSAYCWGTTDPLAGSPATTVPVAVPGGHWFAYLVSGRNTLCGRTTAGQALCWGSGYYGEFGNGGGGNYSAPVPMDRGRDFTRLTIGGTHSCGIEATSEAAYCWGTDDSGELGRLRGHTGWERRPVAVVGPH